MQIIFHVGFPKAASTTLQKQLFAQHPELVNLGIYPKSNIGIDDLHPIPPGMQTKIKYLDDDRISRLYRLLIHPNGLEYNREIAEDLWLQLLSDYGNLDPCESASFRIVLSHESVTSCRFAHPETKEKLRRLHDIFGEIKIILVIRNQVEMLKSLYRDHPFDPRTLEFRPRPVSFSEWLDIDIKRGPLSLCRSLYFGKVSEELCNLFGKQNVLVLPMEWLKSDLNMFSTKISCFLDIDQDITYSLLDKPPINTSVSALGHYYRTVRSNMLLLARYFPSLKKLFLPLDSALFGFLKKIGPASDVALNEKQIKLLHQMYADDNLRLAKYTGLDLKNLSYFL